jgi:tellurite resistance protein
VGAMLLYRLTAGPPVPGPLLPTLAILAAPPAVAGNAWWTITDGAPSTVHTLLVGVLVALLLPQLFLVRRYLATAFAIGFWATTFTAAASATYAVRVLSETHSVWHTTVSWVAVALATALVGSIAVRSVGLLRRRAPHLVPRPPSATSSTNVTVSS